MAQQSNHSRTSESRSDSDVAHIDELLRDLAEADNSPESLMRDHLEAARFYLLGSMPAEYQLSMKLAERLLSDIKNHDLQGRIREFLESQRSRET